MRVSHSGCLAEKYLAAEKNKARRYLSGEPFQGKITSCPFCPVLIDERGRKSFLQKKIKKLTES